MKEDRFWQSDLRELMSECQHQNDTSQRFSSKIFQGCYMFLEAIKGVTLAEKEQIFKNFYD